MKYFALILFTLSSLAQYDKSPIEIDSEAEVSHITFGAEVEGSELQNIRKWSFIARDSLLFKRETGDKVSFLQSIYKALKSSGELSFIKAPTDLASFQSMSRKQLQLIQIVIFLHCEEDLMTKIPIKFDSFLNIKNESTWLKLFNNENSSEANRVLRDYNLLIGQLRDRGEFHKAISTKKLSPGVVNSVNEAFYNREVINYNLLGLKPDVPNFLIDIVRDNKSWELHFAPQNNLYDFFEMEKKFQAYDYHKNFPQTRIVIPKLRNKEISEFNLFKFSTYLSMKILFDSLEERRGLHRAFHNRMTGGHETLPDTFEDLASIPPEDRKKYITDLNVKSIVKLDSEDDDWRNDNNFSFEIRAGSIDKDFRDSLIFEVVEEAKKQEYQKYSLFPSVIENESLSRKFIKKLSESGLTSTRKEYEIFWNNLPVLWDFNHYSWRDYLGNKEATELANSAIRVVNSVIVTENLNDKKLRKILSDWIKSKKGTLTKITDFHKAKSRLVEMERIKGCSFHLGN